jgi:hypothetical protein
LFSLHIMPHFHRIKIMRLRGTLWFLQTSPSPTMIWIVIPLTWESLPSQRMYTKTTLLPCTFFVYSLKYFYHFFLSLGWELITLQLEKNLWLALSIELSAFSRKLFHLFNNE